MELKRRSLQGEYDSRGGNLRKPRRPLEQAPAGLIYRGAESRDQPTSLEPFVDADEAAKFLQLQRRRVLQLARQGKLPAYPIGDGARKVWRFRLSELATAMLHSRQRSHVPEGI